MIFKQEFDPKSIDTVLCLKQSTAQSTGAIRTSEGQVYSDGFKPF